MRAQQFGKHHSRVSQRPGPVDRIRYRRRQAWVYATKLLCGRFAQMDSFSGKKRSRANHGEAQGADTARLLPLPSALGRCVAEPRFGADTAKACQAVAGICAPRRDKCRYWQPHRRGWLRGGARQADSDDAVHDRDALLGADRSSWYRGRHPWRWTKSARQA